MTRPASRTGIEAAEAWIDSLEEPRRSEVRHLHDVIRAAIPDADVVVMDYSGPIVGYGTYDYSTSRGPAGRWFSVGLASRKACISLYMMGADEHGYLAEQSRDRLPGTTVGKSCINIRKPELVEDEVVADLARRSWERYRDPVPQRTHEADSGRDRGRDGK
jgi:hypothetical protein